MDYSRLVSACVNDAAHAWGWCLWTAKVMCHPGVRIVSRAVDAAGNVQQEYPVWNYRGVLFFTGGATNMDDQ